MNQDELKELVKDYKDCIDYINNFDKYDITLLYVWANNIYYKWINKDSRNKIAITGGNVPPQNEIDATYNSLNNLKVTLQKIASINNIKLE